mmetsp:Transcript_37926/g.77403  ORF Transcript_37926/g.77403 Transcript_37926/m.77403 type:complete len:235 (-) Transcript_37926:294-998(-)|eukprot:CAMPEP_0183308790 /NCGR_PEP_ID=MMETSP0160_2-20130417/22467_1 /TAXON_ID=2839 ORGANISM="Odontella Sinensis, Strain Grunow 1884" /NCGR_SAMPLE_ID=MMETSP0160_2 /ASSEMBLY_ACC=CAM_ASM_000250 /LENGTH=234 /DNA_ID=CAMNT_0025472691 /DNA_START=43 /DNA_END=747 /DNA_ORIENTATION=-
MLTTEVIVAASFLSLPTLIVGFSKVMSAPFAINVKFKVKPERRDEFLRIMKNNIKQTMTTEPNALQFLIGKDLDEEDVYFLHEEYKSRQDHADPHSKTTYYEECMAFFATEPFAEPHQADEFALAHDPPAEKVPSREAVCLNVELCIKPEVREEFLKVIRNNKSGSDQEPLCLQYSWGESVHAPNSFYFHEQYVGEEGIAAHNAAPHFKVWEDFASTNPFTKPPVVQKYETLLN